MRKFAYLAAVSSVSSTPAAFARDAAAARDDRAGIDSRPVIAPRLGSIGSGSICFAFQGGALAHRNGLASQQRLVGFQCRCFEQQGIGGNPVASVQNENVAFDHLAPRNASRLAVADDEGARRRQVAQRLQDVLGPRFS
ncbi:hypothetical protein OY671_007453, partial [Metschnikowia pulcherrima]